MTAIGIDTHKDSLAACAVDELGAVLGEASFANDPAGHADVAAWAARVAPGARLGFEGSSTYGAAAGRTIERLGYTVCEVPPQLSRRERSRPPGGGLQLDDPDQEEDDYDDDDHPDDSDTTAPVVHVDLQFSNH